MKNFLLGCFLFIATSLTFADEKKCVPIDVPNPATQKACPDGFKGLQFKRTIVTCPDGKVKESEEFDKSQCVPIGGGQVDKCKINPVLCMEKPSPLGCPPGKHWTLVGLPYAHCVSDDPVCPWGTTLVYDSVGEPSCKPNTCPSNQVLQADGKTCSCPASTPVWDGARCVAPPQCLNRIVDTNFACPNGQSGNITMKNTYDCNNVLLSSVEIGNTCRALNCPDPWQDRELCPDRRTWRDFIVSYTPVNGVCQPRRDAINQCPSDPTPLTCPSETVRYSSCPVGQSGQVKTTTRYNVINNACVPYNETDVSGCADINTPADPTCPQSSTRYESCPSGQSGQVRVTTSYTGRFCNPSTAYDTSGCKSATPDPTQPTQPTCPATSTQYGACPGGQSGQVITTTTYSGANCTPFTSTDTSNCTVNCQTNSTTETASCGAGYIGVKSRVVSVNSCTGTSYGAWDASSCIPDVPVPTCPAGGPQNYPLCRCGNNEQWNGSQCVQKAEVLICSNGENEGMTVNVDDVLSGKYILRAYGLHYWEQVGWLGDGTYLQCGKHSN